MQALARLIAEEYRDKRDGELDSTGWPRRCERGTSIQCDGWDCGVFTLQVLLAQADTVL